MMTNLSLTSTQVIAGLLLGTLAVYAVILYGKHYFRKMSDQDLALKYKGWKWASPIQARNKYPDVDVFSLQPIFFRLGLVFALALTVAAFSYTTTPKEDKISQFSFSVDEDIEVEVPRSQDAPPPPPPPPPPAIAEVVMTVMEETEDISFVDQSVEASTEIETPAPVQRERIAPPPPPPPPPREDNTREIFVVVEEMPRFPGCEEMAGDAKAKKACSDKKLMEFIYEKIQYPAIARENGVEGNVVVQFVVNADGSVQDMSVVRDIGGGCGEEALRIVTLMNSMPERWTPGKQRGRPVRVMFTLPIRFKLQYN
jgi:protein TonB